ncbi:MAG: putative molybdenum cofactor sulfurase, partial [Streblomastix strix]
MQPYLYGYNGTIDNLRKTQFRHLIGQTYVDFTGSGMYQKEQLERIKDELESNLYGNTNSVSPSAIKSDNVINEMRLKVLKWFNADPNKYIVVFTSGTTGGLKIVGETFPWSDKS